jgi:hypothetical protein
MIKSTLMGVATLGVVGAMALSPASSARPGGGIIILHARSQVEDVQFVDNAPQGQSAGDVLVFTERLLDARGRRIGSDAATCTLLFDGRSLCTGTYVLRGGQLMVQLIQPGPEGTYTQAITGGTGRFAHATGTVRVDQRPGGDRFTFRIRRPAGRG